MMFNNGQLLMLSHPFKQIVLPYLWTELLFLLVTSFDKFCLELFNNYVQSIDMTTIYKTFYSITLVKAIW
jgi:hypothetical protein